MYFYLILTLDKIIELVYLDVHFALFFFYLAVNRLITDKTQNIFYLIAEQSVFVKYSKSMELEYSDYISCREENLPNDRGPGYDTKTHLIERLQFCRYEECGVPLHCHFSEIPSDLKW